MARKVNATGRSKGEPKHVRLYEWELASAGYRSLSCYARVLLIELKRLYNGQNNGEIGLSVREAADRMGVGKNLAHKTFDELERAGFIVPMVEGAFRRKIRHATTWRLTEYGCSNDLPTKDFMRSEIQNTVPREGTRCPSRRDTLSLEKGQGVPICPSTRDREGHSRPHPCPSTRDTHSLPSRGSEQSDDHHDQGGLVGLQSSALDRALRKGGPVW